MTSQKVDFWKLEQQKKPSMNSSLLWRSTETTEASCCENRNWILASHSQPHLHLISKLSISHIIRPDAFCFKTGVTCSHHCGTLETLPDPAAHAINKRGTCFIGNHWEKLATKVQDIPTGQHRAWTGSFKLWSSEDSRQHHPPPFISMPFNQLEAVTSIHGFTLNIMYTSVTQPSGVSIMSQ